MVTAIILGIIQGIAEFLPISSSGHLAIFSQLLGADFDDSLLFDVLLHVGTLVAVFIVFYKDIAELIVEGFGIIRDLFTKKILANSIIRKQPIINTPYRRFVMLVIVASIPTAILGLAFKDLIEQASNTLLIPGVALLITATLLMVTQNLKIGKKDASNMTFKDTLFIGTIQGFATFPGISRSGATITAGLFCGLDKEYATKFSFIMSIPAILGAALLEVKDVEFSQIEGSLLGTYIAGMIAAAVVGFICIKVLIVILNKNKLHYFSYYCYGMGIVAIVGSFFVK